MKKENCLATAGADYDGQSSAGAGSGRRNDGGAADAPVVTELAGEEQTPENSADTEEPEESEAP